MDCGRAQPPPPLSTISGQQIHKTRSFIHKFLHLNCSMYAKGPIFCLGGKHSILSVSKCSLVRMNYFVLTTTSCEYTRTVTSAFLG